jgi:hypothetical protein
MTARPLALVATLIVGCSSMDATNPPPAPVGPTDPAAPASLHEQLAAGASFDVSAHGSTVSLTARLVAEGDALPPRALPVIGGSVALRSDADGRLVVDTLDVAFDDVVLTGEEFPPDGLHLTGMRVTLDAPAACEPFWSESGDTVVATPRGEMVLEWAIVAPDGTLVPLAPQHFSDVPLDFVVERTERGTLSLALTGGAAGTFWSWGGIAELSDLTFDVAAATAGE